MKNYFLLIIKIFKFVGTQGIACTKTFGSAGLLLTRTLFNRSATTPSWLLFREQLYYIGVQSLLIIVLAGLFIGMVLGVQGYTVLSRYGSTQSLGAMVAISLLRELGPVITALLFIGRAGSALTAEIALMKSTEQLAALEMMAIDPLRRIIAPRFWAGIVSLPLLTSIFISVGIWGSSKVGINWKGVEHGYFWSIMQNQINWYDDLFNCLIKSILFSITTMWIALFNGYSAQPTSIGISQATTRTVIQSSIVVLALDLLLTATMFAK